LRRGRIWTEKLMRNHPDSGSGPAGYSGADPHPAPAVEHLTEIDQGDIQLPWCSEGLGDAGTVALAQQGGGRSEGFRRKGRALRSAAEERMRAVVALCGRLRANQEIRHPNYGSGNPTGAAAPPKGPQKLAQIDGLS